MPPHHVIQAKLNISPNTGGLPGLPQANSIVGALMTYGFIACVAAIVIGAATWAMGSHMANPHHAEKGRNSVLYGGAAATLIGSSVGLVNFFSAIHLT